MTLRLAHFAVFSPHSTGQYATVKDLILAERRVGIDAQFIDYGLNQKAECREGLVDGDICTVPLAWANEADIVVRHSDVPLSVFDGKKRVLFALHGRPENSFRLEQYKKSPIISTIMKAAKSDLYNGFITFWPEFVYYWSSLINDKVHYVPSPINLDEYKPSGERHNFGKYWGDPNIVIADRWREDTTPFNIVFAANYFKENFCSTARVHIYGIPTGNTCMNFLAPFQRTGIVGQTCGIVDNLSEILRSADILLTPNTISTRIIREAMASGLPIVAPNGCKFTPYTAEPRDTKGFARAINDCHKNLGPKESLRLREQALNEFSLDVVGNAVKDLFEKVIGETPKKSAQWNAMSITADDWEIIKEVVESHDIKTVTEFGSGVSTKLLDGLGVKVTSFETSMTQIEKSIQSVPGAKIIPWNGKSIHEISGDMAFIDGPHGGKNREPSYKTVVESNIPLVICHDSHRPEDRKWIDKYFSEWQVLKEGKLLIVLSRDEK